MSEQDRGENSAGDSRTVASDGVVEVCGSLRCSTSGLASLSDGQIRSWSWHMNKFPATFGGGRDSRSQVINRVGGSLLTSYLLRMPELSQLIISGLPSFKRKELLAEKRRNLH